MSGNVINDNSKGIKALIRETLKGYAGVQMQKGISQCHTYGTMTEIMVEFFAAVDADASLLFFEGTTETMRALMAGDEVAALQAQTKVADAMNVMNAALHLALMPVEGGPQ